MTNREKERVFASGFTLIELMLVTAIIGILAAVSIPSFQTYMAKSRMGEAQIDLAAAYSALKSAYLDNGTYTACLSGAGFVRDQGTHYYTLGFRSSNNSQSPNNPMLDNCPADTDGNTFYLANTVAGSASIPARTDLPAGTAPSRKTYLLGTVGTILSGPVFDKWTIDNTKQTLHLCDGTLSDWNQPGPGGTSIACNRPIATQQPSNLPAAPGAGTIPAAPQNSATIPAAPQNSATIPAGQTPTLPPIGPNKK